MRQAISLALALSFALIAGGCGRPRQAYMEEISFGQPDTHRRLVSGFSAVQESWRWMDREAKLLLDAPVSESTIHLVLDLTVPQELINEYPSVTLSVRVNGTELPRKTYSAVGRVLYSEPVPPGALKKQPALVEFAVDRAVKDPITGQLRGLIAVTAAFKEYEQTKEYKEFQLARARAAYQKLLETTQSSVPPEKRRELLRLFHDLPVWESLSFRNTRMIKNPLDLFIMQQLIFEIQPDYIVETGTYNGGSALYWAFVLEGMGLTGSRVITVDLGDYTQHVATEPLWKKYVEFIRGSSVEPRVVEAIAKKVRGKTVIVTLDSDHSMGHVLKELKAYAPMVSPGSYLIVEDTHLDAVPTHPEQGAGPYGAVEEFLAKGGDKEFERDFTREALILTFNPGGWLRRKAD